MSDFLRKGVLAGATAFGLLWSGAALADVPPGFPLQPPPADSVLTGVTVSVPKVIETTRYGVVSSEVQLSVRVPYGDLDLTTPSGLQTLDRRVKEAANYVCGQLQNMYPVGSPDTFYCAKKAVGDAQPQVVLARAPG
jgi:UrcA family protein